MSKPFNFLFINELFFLDINFCYMSGGGEDLLALYTIGSESSYVSIVAAGLMYGPSRTAWLISEILSMSFWFSVVSKEGVHAALETSQHFEMVSMSIITWFIFLLTY